MLTPAQEQFLEDPRIHFTSGCWEWLGWLRSDGYPQLKRNTRAHRWAYEIWKGPIPVGLQLDHLCRTPKCVNPSHLEAVTKDENNRRGNSSSARRGRQTHCQRGHELAGKNLYVNKITGYRTCKRCKCDLQLMYDRIKKELAHGY